MKFRTQFEKREYKGESYDGILMVTQPGQSFTTREIYERFLVTGRVAGTVRQSVYDSDELNREPDFDDYDETQRPDFDLSDVTSHRDGLTNSELQRKEINRLAANYAVGKISFDEFVYQANRQNPEFARPLIDYYGSQLKSRANGAAQEQAK